MRFSPGYSAGYCGSGAAWWDMYYAQSVINKVHDKYHLNWGIGHALKHFVWMAEVAFRTSKKGALALGHAHEAGTPKLGGPDRKRDFKNNRLGASVGARTHAWSIFGARKYIVKQSWKYFHAHRLWCVRGKGIARCHD